MNRAINTYGESEPCSVVSHPELDQVPRLRLRIEPPPIDISLAMGDALGCMRAALDHLAWGFANGTGTINTKFPLAQPEKVRLPGTRIQVPSGKGKLVYSRSKGATAGWSDAAIEFVKMHNPQQGDPSWATHPLAFVNMMVNADKHKMIRVVSATTTEARYRLIALEVEGGVSLAVEPDGTSILSPTFAQVLENGDDIELFKFQAGQKITKLDIQPITSVKVSAEGWPSEEIGIAMIRCHEAIDGIVTSAESSWDELVPSSN